MNSSNNNDFANKKLNTSPTIFNPTITSREPDAGEIIFYLSASTSTQSIEYIIRARPNVISSEEIKKPIECKGNCSFSLNSIDTLIMKFQNAFVDFPKPELFFDKLTKVSRINSKDNCKSDVRVSTATGCNITNEDLNETFAHIKDILLSTPVNESSCVFF